MKKIHFGGILVLLLCLPSMLFAADWEIVWQPEQPFRNIWGSSFIFAVDFVNAKDGWMTGVYNVILHTDDGGVTWQKQDSGFKDDISKWFDVSFPSPTQGWISGYYRMKKQGQTIHQAVILHTIDGGVTWNQKQVGELPLIIQFFTTRRGVALGAGGTVFRTIDEGRTWEEHPHQFWGAVYGGYFVNMNEGWVVGNGVFHTTDGGVTWEQNQMIRGHLLDEAYFINPQEGWVGGGGLDFTGQIFHTKDGGITFKKHTIPECPRVGGIYFANAKEGWVVGGKKTIGIEEFGVILHTTDSGRAWEVQSRIDDYLVDICSDGAGRLWAVGNKGTVLTYFDPNLFVAPANMKLTGWGNIKRGVE